MTVKNHRSKEYSCGYQGFWVGTDTERVGLHVMLQFFGMSKI